MRPILRQISSEQSIFAKCKRHVFVPMTIFLRCYITGTASQENFIVKQQKCTFCCRITSRAFAAMIMRRLAENLAWIFSCWKEVLNSVVKILCNRFLFMGMKTFLQLIIHVALRDIIFSIFCRFPCKRAAKT